MSEPRVLTSDEVDEIGGLLKPKRPSLAKPPWSPLRVGYSQIYNAVMEGEGGFLFLAVCASENDVKFVVAARQLVPRLVATIRDREQQAGQAWLYSYNLLKRLDDEWVKGLAQAKRIAELEVEVRRLQPRPMYGGGGGCWGGD